MTSRNARPNRRAGFTLTESLISLAVLAVAAGLVAQFVVWSLAERSRSEARLEAVEVATNVLEQAQDRPWKDLSAEWANGQKVPESLSARWPDCKLAVRVEPEPERPLVKRVTVEITWSAPGHDGWAPVTLTGLYAARTTEGNS